MLAQSNSGAAMRNLVEEAEAGYEQLGKERRDVAVLKLPPSDFDFLTSQEISVIPVHVIEARREEQRRHGTVNRDTSLFDFIKAIGLEEADTEDPVNGYSVLHIKESTRAYFGEQEEEVYRVFRNNMIRCTEDSDWLKHMSFLSGQTADECKRQRILDRGAQAASDAELMMPVTNYKQAFFAKKSKKANE
ncbi:conserved hypothetical protein [Leishmania major strain Friedlin]|uniref:Uncharacterized protein n=1 Tax=Leishmania major TaxID=5664 RepID=Q4Q5A2_LEIMA|nr:conserved hypothetical protein [Leishmania major strain Friedlin]CAG9580289.1 hypothetical_protein_-_conserved [Leishmania major strain Friedlin]CAJ08700.1 conserved hypothetical protein [Leishmania major strain Friedlin]|eukprot:XP_001685496.1 conserved hypothetical protein [Leishmania major strain Friedlin]